MSIASKCYLDIGSSEPPCFFHYTGRHPVSFLPLRGIKSRFIVLDECSGPDFPDFPVPFMAFVVFYCE